VSAAAVRAERRRWLGLLVLCVGQLMIVLDITAVNVALPSIQSDLHFSQASLAWVVNAYLISFGGLLLLAGRVGDLLGRRRVFLSGLAVFTVASLLCGFARTEELLIGARFLQGIGAAVVSAMVLGILIPLFPTPRETARATSIYSFVASTGASIGLLIGGVVTQALSWHWIFFINLPIGLAVLLFGAALIPSNPGIGVRQGVDGVGAVLVTAAPLLAVYAIIQASDNGWASARTIVLGAAAVALSVAFVLYEARISNPLVPMRIFLSRNVMGANLARALFPVGLFGSFFLGVLYLQHVLGYGALRTGFAFLPQTICVAVLSLFVVGRLVSRFGARSVVIAGLLLVAAGMLFYARTPADGSYVDVLPALLLTGIGAGLFFMPSVTLAMSGAGPRDAGVASGLTNVALQLGAAFGVAVLASLSASRTTSALAAGSSPNEALTSGYRLGYLIAALFVLTAAVVSAIVIRPRMGEQARAGDARVTTSRQDAPATEAA
jgi:EmrB/QacA subfamily drug resistance transporter